MRNLSFVKRMTALGMALMFLVAANVKRVEAAPANNLTPEQIEAIVTDVFNKFAAFDAQGTASNGGLCALCTFAVKKHVNRRDAEGAEATHRRFAQRRQILRKLS
ncbi:MAG TPA: hypothetical protein VFX63_19450 [Pyrinomonadaceae bacterium]|nr:hypothetical protein [Pyrinomonadaceae bacterium]